MIPLHMKVAPDGTVRCLWTETLPLHLLGHLDIQRACAVEFDNDAQTWRVIDAAGECLFHSLSRETCLAWEREHLIAVLENN